MTLKFEKFEDSKWKHIQTVEITEDDLKRLKNYAAHHEMVHGFYKYTYEGHVFFTCISFLLDYIKDMGL